MTKPDKSMWLVELQKKRNSRNAATFPPTILWNLSFSIFYKYSQVHLPIRRSWQLFRVENHTLIT